ncbi:hypothetical protein H5410_046728, partial [Solanum commersonii]
VGVNDPQKDPTWTSLFTNNRAATSGLCLKYIPLEILNGQLVVQQIQEVIIFQSTAKLQLCYHEKGYYVIIFQSTKGLNEVPFFGPYTMNNKHVIMKILFFCPYIMNNKHNRKCMGIPILANECTTEQTRISFTRMLIEGNITKFLPER